MSRAPGKGQKTQALYALHWIPKLKPSSRTVGAWLVWHANASSGRCDPGQTRLREETGLSRRAVQYAVQELEMEQIIKRRLRGNESTSYQVNWQKLSDLVRTYEERLKAGVVAVTPAERDMRGRKSVRHSSARTCASEVQELAPKLSEANSVKEPVFPVGTFSEEENGDESDETVARKLLNIGADHAFLAALDREVQKGRRFSPEDAERFYERLEALCGDGERVHGDPIAGRACRLLETELARETIA
ncbi:hypothetical protein CO731_01496 [Aminobacter sp. MSH1]|nr:hypothetical protein CO731_01496 [Aminobacter sp. MSH1]